MKFFLQLLKIQELKKKFFMIAINTQKNLKIDFTNLTKKGLINLKYQKD